MDEFTIRSIGRGAATTPHDRKPRSEAEPDRTEDRTEADAVATWFARIGAVALLLAAGFGYSYGVDRGLLTEPVRVAAGLLLAVMLLVGSEAARRRDWPALAQAVAGAGLGVSYLSTWAAYERYGLLAGGPAFAALATIAAAGVALALRHDSEVLAMLSALGAFLVPYLVSNSIDPLPVLGYVALVDAGILATVSVRAWHTVPRIALMATWLFAFLSAGPAGPGPSLVYGAGFWALFALHPVARSALGRRTLPEEPAFAVANAFAFWAFAMTVMTPASFASWRGELTAALGLAYFGQWASLHAAGARARMLATATAALGGSFLALAVPIEFDGHVVAAGWTVQGVVLVAIGRTSRSAALRRLGLGLLAAAVTASLLVEFQLGAAYAPGTPVLSGPSLTLLLQIGALHAVAGLLRRTEPSDDVDRQAETASSVSAHGIALWWVAMEAMAHSTRTVSGDPSSAIQFAVTVGWSGYAAALLAAGVLMQRRRARLVALATFALTIGKVVIVDLWLLTPPQRVVAFGALGLFLIASSAMYHRFRALIVEA